MKEDKMVEVIPAHVMGGILSRTLEWYLPDELKSKFLEIGEHLSFLNAHEWEVRFSFCRSRLATALADLKGEAHLPSSVAMMRSWEDDVLFFYVLHFQFVWVRLHVMKDEMVPALFEGFWDWAMKPLPMWYVYTAPIKWEYMQLAAPPMIWQFFAPCDIEMEKR